MPMTFVYFVFQRGERRAGERDTVICGSAASIWDHPSGKRPGSDRDAWTTWWNSGILPSFLHFALGACYPLSSFLLNQSVSSLVLNLDTEQKLRSNIHHLILCVVSMVTAQSVKCECLRSQRAEATVKSSRMDRQHFGKELCIHLIPEWIAAFSQADLHKWTPIPPRCTSSSVCALFQCVRSASQTVSGSLSFSKTFLYEFLINTIPILCFQLVLQKKWGSHINLRCRQEETLM